MYCEAPPEDLLDELARLAGRPRPVVQDATARVLTFLGRALGRDDLDVAGRFPLTSWPALLEGTPVTAGLWEALGAAGLTREEGFTVLAVIDDHVRRRFGNGAWARLPEWAPDVLSCYDAPASHFGPRAAVALG